MLAIASPSFFLFFMFLASFGAGVLGSIVGIGGGLLVTPILTLIFGVDIHLAIGASIVSIIATSSGAAAAYVKDKITNLRVGMFLEIATTLGALTGAAIAAYVNSALLFALFGTILILTVLPSIRRRSEELPSISVVNDAWAQKLKLGSTYHDARMKTDVPYQVQKTPVGLSVMYLAGLASGLLGIGGGTFKVLGMESAMRLPMKVSTTTSNFMIGVTAAASAGIYVVRGDVNPFIAAPVMLGILGGAMVGSKLLVRSTNVAIRRIFIVVLLFVAADMILKAGGILP